MCAQCRSREGGRSGLSVRAAAARWAMGGLVTLGTLALPTTAPADATTRAMEVEPTNRYEAWSGRAPDHAFAPAPPPEVPPEVLSESAPDAPGTSPFAYAMVGDAFPVDAVAWSVPSDRTPEAAPPPVDPITIPLPTAGWAGLALLILMASWRGMHIRQQLQ